MDFKVHDYINNPDWHTPQTLEEMFSWATSPEVEGSGEARRQLGYYDAYVEKRSPASRNRDYLHGYAQGLAMRKAEASVQ